jgi:hypothetical protein
VTLRYRYLFNAAYCKTVISRFYRQRPFYLRLHYQFAAIALILLVAWFSTQPNAEHSSRAPFVALCVTGAAIFGFMLLVRFAIMFKLRKSREFGKEVSIALTGEGLEASGSNGRSSVKWSAYPRSVRYSDGILLTRGGAIRWLPHSALEEGTVQEVIDLVRANTNLRSIGAG